MTNSLFKMIKSNRLSLQTPNELKEYIEENLAEHWNADVLTNSVLCYNEDGQSYEEEGYMELSVVFENCKDNTEKRQQDLFIEELVERIS